MSRLRPFIVVITALLLSACSATTTLERFGVRVRGLDIHVSGPDSRVTQAFREFLLGTLPTCSGTGATVRTDARVRIYRTNSGRSLRYLEMNDRIYCFYDYPY